MENIREKLKELLTGNKVSQAHIAKAIGMSATTVSLYADGKYAGDGKKMDRLIKGFLRRYGEEQACKPFVMPIIETSTMKNIFEVANYCHIQRKMGIAYGDAGIGKTCAIKEYLNVYPDAFLIEADPIYSERDLFRDLHQAMIGEPSGSVHQMFDACVDRLSDSGRLLIIDEAEYLNYKSLNQLRRLHDKARIGIMMVGMPKLRANLIGKNYTQLYSRISKPKCLGVLKPSETEDIINAIIPEKADLWSIYHHLCKGIVRNLANLIEQSIRLSEINKEPITAAGIKVAAERLII